jgi:hypothetical protein
MPPIALRARWTTSRYMSVKEIRIVSEGLPTGTWLLDARLLYRKIDVRIQGTRCPMWQNGRYKDQLGFTVLTEQLQTVESPVVVKVGYEEK